MCVDQIRRLQRGRQQVLANEVRLMLDAVEAKLRRSVEAIAVDLDFRRRRVRNKRYRVDLFDNRTSTCDRVGKLRRGDWRDLRLWKIDRVELNDEVHQNQRRGWQG